MKGAVVFVLLVYAVNDDSAGHIYGVYTSHAKAKARAEAYKAQEYRASYVDIGYVIKRKVVR